MPRSDITNSSIICLGLWDCPESVAKALKQAKGIRMVVATPAIFQNGWFPGWLDPKNLTGKPPESDVLLQLRGACVERWRAVSGWNLEKGKRGPKAIRRLAPAGSVYFFERKDGDPADLAKLWLKSVSDNGQDGQDRRDGFGLAM